MPVRGRAVGTSRSGVLTRVRSVSVDEPAELFGGLVSELFFLVMLRALTGPSWAMLRTELAGLTPGIWIRIGLSECLGSIWGTGGVWIEGVSAGLLEPLDLTLTTAAFPRTIV